MSFYTPPPSKGGQLRTLLFNLAVYTGAVTVNGMPWIAGIDYSESVDLSYTHDPKFCGYVAIQLKEASNKDSAKFLPIIEFSVLQTVGLLTAQLASLCGSELKSGGA
ncbi:hypothetical protein BDR26DRAFT_896047 [Obelidium mucronatum]|nr:hypothetical protein BDR26DRAFT_896047 [Obelidium mucronatum]